MLPVIQIGPLAVQAPGLALLAGLWLGLILAERWLYVENRNDADETGLKGHSITSNDLYNLAFIGLIFGALGGRLAYAARYNQAFAASPFSLVSLNSGLFDPLGGGATACLAGLAFSQRKRLPLWPVLDALTPLLAIMGLALGISHLASGEAFGAETDLPWAIELWGAKRHPSQVYEIGAALLILAAIWPKHGPLERLQKRPGFRFLLFVAASAAARLALEAFRGDSPLLAGGLRTLQVLTWLILAVCLGMLARRFGREAEDVDGLER